MSEDWRNLEIFRFGDSAELADRLANLVVNASKRATCWSVADGQQTDVGKQMVVLDGSGTPRAIPETIELIQRRFCDVDWEFANDEGEGDATLEDWHHRAGHALDMTRIRPQAMLSAMIGSFDGMLAALEGEIGLLLV